MSITSYIPRILLAVLLLLAPSRGVKATPAGHGSDVPCGVLRAVERHDAARVDEERYTPPKGAVLLNAWSVTSAACMQGGQAGGAGGYTAIYPAATFLQSLLHNGSTTELRRWQVLFSTVRDAQLEAHYPAHGFW